MTTETLTDAEAEIAGYRLVLDRGPVQLVRVSSAQARGRAKSYSYFGCARYEVAIGARGTLTCRPLSRASSERRSYDLAVRDAERIEEETGAIACAARGTGAGLPECLGAAPADLARMILAGRAQDEIASLLAVR